MIFNSSHDEADRIIRRCFDHFEHKRLDKLLREWREESKRLAWVAWLRQRKNLAWERRETLPPGIPERTLRRPRMKGR